MIERDKKREVRRAKPGGPGGLLRPEGEKRFSAKRAAWHFCRKQSPQPNLKHAVPPAVIMVGSPSLCYRHGRSPHCIDLLDRLFDCIPRAHTKLHHATVSLKSRLMPPFHSRDGCFLLGKGLRHHTRSSMRRGLRSSHFDDGIPSFPRHARGCQPQHRQLIWPKSSTASGLFQLAISNCCTRESNLCNSRSFSSNTAPCKANA